MVQQTSRGLEVEAEVAWGGRGFAAVRGGAGDEIAQYRDEACAQGPKIRPSSSKRQQGGPEKIEARRLCGRRAISTKVLGIRIQPADSR